MKQPLSIIRGTTQKINISVRNESGAPYLLSGGEVLRFGVKKRPEDSESQCVIKKNLTSADMDGEYYVMTLLPDDTKNLDFGTYYYDVGMQDGNNYYNVIECSEFKLTYNITTVEASS